MRNNSNHADVDALLPPRINYTGRRLSALAMAASVAIGGVIGVNHIRDNNAETAPPKALMQTPPTAEIENTPEQIELSNLNFFTLGDESTRYISNLYEQLGFSYRDSDEELARRQLLVARDVWYRDGKQEVFFTISAHDYSENEHSQDDFSGNTRDDRVALVPDGYILVTGAADQPPYLLLMDPS